MSDGKNLSMTEQIRALIAGVAGGSETLLASVATELGALPVCWDANGGFALRPDSTVIAFFWPHAGEWSVEEVSDRQTCVMAIYQGSLRHHQLATLVPERPPDARTCPSCEGSGRAMIQGRPALANVVCLCGGLGWILTTAAEAQLPQATARRNKQGRGRPDRG